VGRDDRGARVGATGAGGRAGLPPVAMDNEPWRVRHPGPERPVRLGPTALEYEVPKGQAPL